PGEPPAAQARPECRGDAEERGAIQALPTGERDREGDRVARVDAGVDERHAAQEAPIVRRGDGQRAESDVPVPSEAGERAGPRSAVEPEEAQAGRSRDQRPGADGDSERTERER